MTQERELEQHEEEQEHEIHEQYEEEAAVDSGAAGGSVSETTTAYKKWKARSHTTWPIDVVNGGEVNEDRHLLDQRTLMRLSRVCGLTAWERVLLTLEKFEDLTDDEKNELFVNSIQWYVLYPEELKEKGKRAAMKGISHSWRGYKNRLVTCLWKKQNPFEKFKDLKEEVRERFVAKYESPEFVANNEYMRQLRAQNELN
jgi:hypothetical protein